ncbi:hypothetical protein ISN44_As13g009150 [Arabidopsis suecica]|uniref:Uncharacterized protein n=1 Tax=Arabidopsis suecica TaxID=45249 RepID=A0A8T1XSA9_ARASU|nr:hypothetical protein ISN44_As13g009150 [Arabidopsis suecica]
MGELQESLSMGGVLKSYEESEGSNVIEEVPMREFHIPQPLMEIIVSKVGEDGVDALKNLFLAGREGKDAVLSKKTLSSVRINMDPHFMWWSMPHSKYYTFYQKCLAADNPYAKFVEKHKALCYESTIGYFQMRCRWNVSHDKRMVDDMNVCVVQPPFQPGRVGRPRCPRCKRVGHRFNRCVD